MLKGLLYVKSLLRKLAGGSELPSNLQGLLYARSLLRNMCNLPEFHETRAGTCHIIYLSHFRQALQLHKSDSGPFILDIINTIEGDPPVDVRSM